MAINFLLLHSTIHSKPIPSTTSLVRISLSAIIGCQASVPQPLDGCENGEKPPRRLAASFKLVAKLADDAAAPLSYLMYNQALGSLTMFSTFGTHPSLSWT